MLIPLWSITSWNSKMKGFPCLKVMVRIHWHEAVNEPGSVTNADESHDSYGLPASLTDTLHNDPRFTMSRTAWARCCLASSGHTSHSSFHGMFLSLVHGSPSACLSIPLFPLFILICPKKGKHSKCLMHILCLYVSLQNVYCCFVCIFWLCIKATGCFFLFPLSTLFLSYSTWPSVHLGCGPHRT